MANDATNSKRSQDAGSPSQPLLGFVTTPAYAPAVERAAEALTSEASVAGAEAGSAVLGPVATAIGTVGAAIAAGGSVALAGETVRAAIQGEKTPLEVADDYYQTHFADLWGWLKGDYSNAVKERRTQFQEATRDTSKIFSDSKADSASESCEAFASPAASSSVVTSDGQQELFTEEQQRQLEYKSYKARCAQPPPKGLTLCDEKRWKLQRNKECRSLRQSWDNKWLPGRHKIDIEDLDRGIKKLDDWIRKNCK